MILPDFVCEKTEAQKDFMICPKQHGNENPENSDYKLIAHAALLQCQT